MGVETGAATESGTPKDTVHMNISIAVSARDGFADDKDRAIELRSSILPALTRNESVVVDFAGVAYATQSFVHALIAEALQRYGEGALDLIEFRNCSDAVRTAIEVVVGYTLDGFAQKGA
jgi:uncharacterized protein DUF4325